MPLSYPNNFDVSSGGDIASAFLYVAGTPTRDAVCEWGVSGLVFINAFPESSAVGVAFSSPFPSVPQVIMGGMMQDGAPMVAFVEVETITVNGFTFFVRDMNGLNHGPGNLLGFPWFAIAL